MPARRYAVVGDPVAHSLSPRMQNAAFRACGLEATYAAVRARREEGLATMKALCEAGYAGFNITTPLKDIAAGAVDALTCEAACAASVNTVRCDPDALAGHNTDGGGLLRALDDIWSWQPRDRSVLLFGSGPAARAAACALLAAGAVTIQCWSRNEAAAAAIGASPDGNQDLVINALPAGALVPPSVLQKIGRATPIFDMNYSVNTCPIPLGLGGLRSDGRPLLLHQGALAFQWWTGLKPPLQEMRSAIGLA
ncbi:MAG: hypothetical protein GIW99_09925 [Candidatus Eremiobacteraeota bacterium]|nr:hypothetical protein [Candidatus Eremiobacteraeota bacterium]MBC5827980.1 hypothetical protein [Candidatus Eremiobacteraeota bacterium]